MSSGRPSEAKKAFDKAMVIAGVFEPTSLTYPGSKVLYLEAIKEKIPVFEGNFRIIQDVKVTASREFVGSLGLEGKAISISGELKYQACDEAICYPSNSVPVSWQLQVVPLDRQRSPEAIQHK